MQHLKIGGQVQEILCNALSRGEQLLVQSLPLVLLTITVMPSAPVKEADAASQKPVKTIRVRGISASIFANKAKTDGKDITFHKLKLQRAYKNGEEWKHTESFGRDDVPVLQLVLQRAWEAMLEMKNAQPTEEEAE
ncbi:MAG: hypothetical protein FJ271_32610 [Planctomycetes bacterium]|nr:hypothetical protein [Planctomycetota bacterium]